MILGGSCAVISEVMSPQIWVISIVTLLIAPLIPTHDPPSTVWSLHKRLGYTRD